MPLTQEPFTPLSPRAIRPAATAPDAETPTARGRFFSLDDVPIPGVAHARPIGLSHRQLSLMELPMSRAVAWSTGLHAGLPVAIMGLLLLIALVLNTDWQSWFKKDNPADMEFVLVQDTQSPPPEKALFRGTHNQQAGGKNDPKQPITPMEKAAAASKTPPSPKEPTPAQAPPKPVDTMAKQQPKPEIPLPGKAQNTPAKAAPEPVEAVSLPGADAPVMTTGIASGSGTTGEGERTQGNPQGGDHRAAGVDVMQDVDFGPFMSDLEKRIKRNWVPPRARNSKKVIVKFFLKRDGELVKSEIVESSGDKESDRAALAAVDAAAPFKPFPPDVREDILPIEFTFDYNVFNPTERRRARS